MCTRNQALQILEEVYELSKGIYHSSLRDAYLYGSYARGDFNSESDIDILLTVNADRDRISENRVLMSEVASSLSLKYNVTVSVTVKPAVQFDKYSDVLPYYRNVLKEGIHYAV